MHLSCACSFTCSLRKPLFPVSFPTFMWVSSPTGRYSSQLNETEHFISDNVPGLPFYWGHVCFSLARPLNPPFCFSCMATRGISSGRRASDLGSSPPRLCLPSILLLSSPPSLLAPSGGLAGGKTRRNRFELLPTGQMNKSTSRADFEPHVAVETQKDPHTDPY